MKKTTYSGIYSIPVTPFNEDKSIDFKSLRNCLEYFIDKKTDGILLPVNVSEASKLSDTEKNQILEEAINVTEGKIPIIAGVTSSSTEHVLERSKYAEQLGISSIMAMPPIGYASEKDFYTFYEELSNGIKSDIWIQNNKLPAGPTVPSNTLIKIINQIESVDYLKEESANSSQVHSIVKDNCKDNLKSIMGGAGGRFIIDEYRRGSNGIMPSGHMLEAHRVLWDSLILSKKDEVNPDAIEVWKKMLEALNFEFMYSVSAYKYFFWKRGIIRTNVSREPIRELDPYDIIEADRILDKLEHYFF
ncbi:MAG: dihydrodipicolinate synthase family protein [Chloroflexota bacterium]|nr:dihydrodipicolinate synthase family protein [Chloroflexota bacterium]